MAAICHSDLDVAGWTDDEDANRSTGLALARRALRVAGDYPDVLCNVAYVLAYFGEDIATATTLIDRALELKPSFASGWWRSGWIRLMGGQPELAIQHFEIGMRLNPRDILGFTLGIGAGHFFARRFEDAKATLLLAVEEGPGWVPPYRFLASCYAQMGRLDEAREIVKRLRAMTPVVVPRATYWRNPEDRELYLRGLRVRRARRILRRYRIRPQSHSRLSMSDLLGLITEIYRLGRIDSRFGRVNFPITFATGIFGQVFEIA